MPRNLSLQQQLLQLEQPKKPQSLSPSFTPPSAYAPETPKETPLEERIAQLTDTLYQMDLDGRPVQKPFKPFITQSRRRFRGSFDRGCNGHGRCISVTQMDMILPIQISVEDSKVIEDVSNLKDSLKSLTKDPNTKHPRVSARPFKKDKMQVLWMQRIWTPAERLPRTKQTTPRRQSRP